MAQCYAPREKVYTKKRNIPFCAAIYNPLEMYPDLFMAVQLY